MQVEQVRSKLCANETCNHFVENHVGGVCNGSLECRCENFIQSELYAFAQEIEKQKMILKKVEHRVKYILEKIPPTRNAGDKSFPRVYWEIWEGFKIRKGSPMVLDLDTWRRLTHPDKINRAKRKVKQYNEELRTYNPEVLNRQAELFQAHWEWSIEN